MKKAATSLGDNLVSEGLLKPEQLAQIQTEVLRTREPFNQVLRRFQFVREKKLLSFLSTKFKIPQVEITHQIIKPEVLKLIPEPLVRKFSVVPLRKIGKRLSVAMSDPLNLNTLDQLRHASNFDIEPMLATDSEIKSAIDQYYGMKSDMSELVESLREDARETGKAEAPAKEAPTEEGPVIKLVNTMIAQAVKEGVSDVHIAPEKNQVVVRYRVDGVLHQVDEYPKESHASIVSRVKVMASLDISETRVPQDGRVQLEAGGEAVDLRVSAMPTIHGENIVLRILKTSSAVMTLEALGMLGDDLTRFNQLIAKPYGIFLITGPTGSGKTTSLYAAINQINSPNKNIVTIEDPVEYQLPLIRQIQVNPRVNLSFATGLRSILRQDPDIIMVGEIRDRETAEIAIQAALTGHLVFSTLHTNDAASAITRLLDMGIEPFLVSSTVTGIVAQRLVRKICSECRESAKADRSVVEKLNLSEEDSQAGKILSVYRGKGCLTCKKSGYRGRTGIFEVLAPDDEIRKLILNHASSTEITSVAAKKGMRTLRKSGLEKIKSGITSVDEILRVTQEI